jgi:hypothetical protein
MRTFLRHVATGHYFRSPEKWTLDRDDAYDFGLVSKAMKAAHKLRIRDLELVLSFESPEQAPATPFEEFLRGLSRNRKHPVACRGASRLAALA